MLFPPLLVPPSPGRLDTWYCVLAFVCADLCASAGFGSTFIEHDDNGDGLRPVSVQTRVITGMCSFCRTQATKCNPASGISRMKYLFNNLLNCSIKKSLRSEYNFRIRLM